MRKILVLMLASAIVLCGCGRKNNESINNSNISNNEVSEEYFMWADEDYIIGLTEAGAEQTELVVPKECNRFLLGGSELKNLKKMSFANPDTKLEDACFAGKECLEEVVLPENLEMIPEYCFSRCTNLRRITIPKTVNIIEESSFFACESLEKVVIEGNVTEIGQEAFKWDDKLTTVTMNGYVENVGKEAFLHCDSLKELKFNDGLKTISTSAFAQMEGLENIYIPETIESIDNRAFALSNIFNLYIKKGSYADNDELGFWLGNVVKNYY